MYVETLRSIPHSRHGGSTASAPHPYPNHARSPAPYDGLKVLDPLQSCQAGGRVIVEMLLEADNHVSTIRYPIDDCCSPVLFALKEKNDERAVAI